MGSSKAWQVTGSLWFAKLSIVFVAVGVLSLDVASSQAQFQPALQSHLNSVDAPVECDRPYQPPKRGIPGRREAAGSR
ncbi:hypothetical protein ACN4EK_30875 [Pantanalinema rosaneae CENA516]|uniref:hypothetical protein n=1 Tax=Pantanalinema rosaneae TaxID=1620701 RepID=UPI003D6F0C4D